MKTLLILVIIGTFIDLYSGQDFCGQSESKVKHVYNLGENVIISEDEKLWIFRVDQNKVDDRNYVVDEIFGDDTFESVSASFTLRFAACKRETPYCNILKDTNNTIIAIGQKTQGGGSGFISYRLKEDGKLEPISDESILLWGLGSEGTMNHEFWQTDVFEEEENVEFKAFVFNPFRASLLAFVVGGQKNQMVAKKLNPDGSWTKGWKIIESNDPDLYYDGLFNIDGIDYGLNERKRIEKIEWKDASVSHSQEFPIKEMFNCFFNSSLSPEEHFTQFIYPEPGIITIDYDQVTESIKQEPELPELFPWPTRYAVSITPFDYGPEDPSAWTHPASHTNDYDQLIEDSTTNSCFYWMVIAVFIILGIVFLSFIIMLIMYRMICEETKCEPIHVEANSHQQQAHINSFETLQHEKSCRSDII